MPKKKRKAGAEPIYPSGAMGRYNVMLPKPYIEGLDLAAKRRNINRSALLRRIVQRFLEADMDSLEGKTR